jgi:hypothetical protein
VSRNWPFPGDGTVMRARKMYQAMHALATEQQRGVDLLRQLRATMSPRTPLRDQIDDVLDALDDMDDVAGLDKRFADWGEEWHIPQPDPGSFDEDDYVPTKIAATIIPLQRRHIAAMRVDGKIKGKWDDRVGPHGGWTFRVGDLYRLSDEVRSRGGQAWRATRPVGNIPASETGDSE